MDALRNYNPYHRALKEEVKDEVMDCGFVEVDSEDVHQLCTACLCATRSTHSLDDVTLKQYYMNILTESQLEASEPVLQSPKLCWECVAHLKRSVRFREQVQDSYRLLQPMLLVCEEEDQAEFLQTSVCRPGRLSTCFAHSIDISPQDDDAQTMTAEQQDDDGAELLPVQIKEEREDEQLHETDAHPIKEVTKYVNTLNNSNSINEFTHDFKSTFTCDYCYNRFTSKPALERHIATYDIYPHNNKTVPFPCEDCVVVLCSDDQCSECSNGLTLLQHNNMKSSIAEKHQCNVCDKSFSVKATVLGQKEMNIGEHRHKRTRNKRNNTMIKHTNNRTGKKPYECEVCCKSFSRKTDLKTHLRVHTGEKPYQCEMCRKSFSRKSYLKTHRVDIDEKPYQCKVCLKAFSHSSHLIRHMRAHTGAKLRFPTRVACLLTPGTPTVPPPHIPQPWQLKRQSRVNEPVVPLRGSTRLSSPEAIPLKKGKFTPSTGIRDVAPAEVAGVEVLENVQFQLVGFSPTPSTRHSTPTQSPRQEDPRSVSFTTSYRDDTNIFADMPYHPGSDVEDDVDLESVAVKSLRTGMEYAFQEEDIPSSALAQLAELDARDNAALREGAADVTPDLNFEWKKDPLGFEGERELFVGQAGPTFTVKDLTPLQIFQTIWDDAIIEQIVRETNRYANDLLNDPALKSRSRLRQWQDVTKEELWVFFGVIMLQSIVPLPVEKEYWYPSLQYLQVGQFGDIMTFPRFLLLKKCLHFVNNATLPRAGSNDAKKLAKIQPVLDHLNEKFSSLYLPEQNISIDESLLLWKGRLSFVQRIATKAASAGMKSYELCEPRTGYLWKFVVYTGNSEKQQEPEPTEGALSKIVFSLVRPLLNKGHTLVMDDFYNSPMLSRTLKMLKTDTMGTLRLNREFVPESLRNNKKTDLKTGDVAFSHTKDLSIITWKDTSLVSMISTYHKVEVGGKEKYDTYKYKPKVVLDYNLSMGGVGKKDQMLQAFPVERVRNTIWYKKLFRRLLNVSVYNAFVMYTHAKKINQRQFRVQLAGEILGKYKTNHMDTKPKSGHYAIKQSKGRARCKWCARSNLEVRTVWKCDTCDTNLCIERCFRAYHVHMQLN